MRTLNWPSRKAKVVQWFLIRIGLPLYLGGQLGPSKSFVSYSFIQATIKYQMASSPSLSPAHRLHQPAQRRRKGIICWHTWENNSTLWQSLFLFFRILNGYTSKTSTWKRCERTRSWEWFCSSPPSFWTASFEEFHCKKVFSWVSAVFFFQAMLLT